MTCAYSGCRAKAGDRIYCRYHNAMIREKELCFSCLQKKEKPAFRLCRKCHLAEMEAMRQEAIKNGRCTNFAHCDKPASSEGGMCEECFKAYAEKVSTEVETKRQEAIIEGRCTNIKKGCQQQATCDGGMCED